MAGAAEERRPSRRARRRGGPTLLSALFGAGLLVVLGFALGIVAGLMLEEPQLLLDYVTGKTRSVALVPPARVPDASAAPAPSGHADASEAVPEPDVAARAPAPPAPETAPARDAAGGAPKLAPAPVPPMPAASPGAAEPVAAGEAPVAAPAGRGFSVQVGAFADSGPAAQLARKLEDKGLPVYVSPSAGADAKKWRVRVGPLATRDEADRIAARLEKQEKLPTWVMAEGTL